MSDESPLPPEAAAGLRALREPVDPDPLAYDSVAGALRSRDAFRERRSPIRLLAAAAVLTAAFLGGRASASLGPRPAASDPSFALFMLNAPGATYPANLPELEIVEMYRRWAGGLAAGGRLVLGEELAPRRFLVDAKGIREAPVADGVDGMFVVRAPSADSAFALAASLPHVRYGGSVAVQPIMVR